MSNKLKLSSTEVIALGCALDLERDGIVNHERKNMAEKARKSAVREM